MAVALAPYAQSSVGERHIEVPVKLFVGRFPKAMNDDELRRHFEPFGPVQECVILRDSTSKISKGCAFVRFANVSHAIDCIKTLNNKCILDPSIGTLQVQFANGEVERLGISGDHVELPPVKLFVGSIPRHMDGYQLAMVFQPYGEVVETFILTDEKGLSRGSGFVKMRTKEQAAVAINNLNNKRMLEGSDKFIEVRLAVSKLQRERRAFGVHDRVASVGLPGLGYQYSPSPQIDGSRSSEVTIGPTGANIFVFHLPNEWNEEDLRDNFCQFGRILSATVVRDPKTNLSRGFGFVSFDSPSAAARAVKHMHGYEVQEYGKKLKVEIKKGETDDQFSVSQPHVMSPTPFPERRPLSHGSLEPAPTVTTPSTPPPSMNMMHGGHQALAAMMNINPNFLNTSQGQAMLASAQVMAQHQHHPSAYSGVPPTHGLGGSSYEHPGVHHSSPIATSMGHGGFTTPSTPEAQ